MGLLCTGRWLEEGAKSPCAVWRLWGSVWACPKSEMWKWQLDVRFRGSGELLPNSGMPASRAGPALTSCSLGNWKGRHHFTHTQVVKGLAWRVQRCGECRPSQWLCSTRGIPPGHWRSPYPAPA